MKHPSRQAEINPLIVKEIGQTYKKQIVVKRARSNEALEGTGSLIIDSHLRKVYVCTSERASAATVANFMTKFGGEATQAYKLV